MKITNSIITAMPRPMPAGNRIWKERKAQNPDPVIDPNSRVVIRTTGYLQCLFGPDEEVRVNLSDTGIEGFDLIRAGDPAFGFSSLSGGAKEQFAAAVRLAHGRDPRHRPRRLPLHPLRRRLRLH